MNDWVLMFLVIPWLVAGYKSFVYWWIKEFNYTRQDRLVAIFLAFLGPLVFIIGFLVHSEGSEEVLIKKGDKQ